MKINSFIFTLCVLIAFDQGHVQTTIKLQIKKPSKILKTISLRSTFFPERKYIYLIHYKMYISMTKLTSKLSL